MPNRGGLLGTGGGRGLRAARAVIGPRWRPADGGVGAAAASAAGHAAAQRRAGGQRRRAGGGAVGRPTAYARPGRAAQRGAAAARKTGPGGGFTDRDEATKIYT